MAYKFERLEVWQIVTNRPCTWPIRTHRSDDGPQTTDRRPQRVVCGSVACCP